MGSVLKQKQSHWAARVLTVKSLNGEAVLLEVGVLPPCS